MSDDSYTPTEWLLMEVLAARCRLGESCWTFPSTVRPTLNRLELRGILGWKSGIVENTCIAWLSDKGRTEWHLDTPYEPIWPPVTLRHERGPVRFVQHRPAGRGTYRGVTRTVRVGRRWAVKIPRAQLFNRTDGAELVHTRLAWFLRGWLANRSEWRQRRRPDVARPVFTFAHLALVFPKADAVGTWEPEDCPFPTADGEPPAGERGGHEERKGSSWGRFGGTWKLIDFDRAWQHGDRGLLGGLYYWNQERLARQWSKLPPPSFILEDT